MQREYIKQMFAYHQAHAVVCMWGEPWSWNPLMSICHVVSRRKSEYLYQ